jgi:hypothetical protein
VPSGFLRAVIVPLILASTTVSVRAQDGAVPRKPRPTNEVSVTAAVLLSWQPANGTFTDSLPYIDHGLGGFAPGAAIAVVFRHRRAAAIAEFSTATEISIRQTGRTVGGQSTGGLRDSFAGVLAGIDVDGVKLLAGVARVFGWPTKNGEPILPHFDDDGGRFAPGAGMDWTAATRSRAALTTTLRYAYVPRTRSAFQRGVGHHVFRAGVGLSVKLSER